MQPWNLKSTQPDEEIRRDILQKGSQVTLFVSFASLFMALVVVTWALFEFGNGGADNTGLTELSIANSKFPRSAFSTSPFSGDNLFSTEQRPPQSNPLVGIIVGHAGYDSGAVCPDGLTEAEINLAVAEETASYLNRRNIDTELLDEFDARLDAYWADALISIHADSCSVAGASGFKVARISASAIPEAEDHLVSCITQEYQRITGLTEHTTSITPDMTNYHAFRSIASGTPSAIIEAGFMLEDRLLLERNPSRVGRGIASGILCFLNPEDSTTAN